jgi:putative DNA primase/helicase
MAEGHAPISDELLAMLEAEEARRAALPTEDGPEPEATQSAPPAPEVAEVLDITKPVRKRKPKRPPADGIDDGLRPAWELKLIRDGNGIVKPSIANVELILTEHESWRGLLIHDAFAERTSVVASDDGRTPPCTECGYWRDIDTTRLRVWIANNYRLDVGADLVDAVVESVAHRQARHPVREYLAGLQWDGTFRIATMFEHYFGAPTSIYHAEIARMWMVSGVARVMQPGCQADYMIVLEGVQGIRKSTSIKILAKGWSADTTIDIGRPDAMQALRGVWIYELAELASIRSAKDVEKVRGFLTSRNDHYRLPYARRTTDSPRQCIFAGSTNEKYYLNDPTGNRRQWPVLCGQIDTDALEADVDQLWAEAFEGYKGGALWYPQTVEVVKMCAEEQAARTQSDPWLPIVEQWVNRDPMWFHVGGESDSWVRVADGITTTDALLGAVKMPRDRIDRQAESRMGRMLRECGLEAKQLRTGTTRVRRYYLSQPVTTCHNPDEVGVVTEQEALFPFI